MKINWKALLISLAVTLGIPLLLSLLSGSFMASYQLLNKPPLSPPGWLFGVVWPILYVLMGIAAYLVWQSGSPERLDALFYYLIQLIVNSLWSIIFFRWENYLLAFVWLLALIVLVVITIIKFKPINKGAAYLLLPYLAWLLFAAYLNYGVWVLNK